MIYLGNDDATGVNQILPHKNKWAWDLFIRGCANNWMPTEISMQMDIKQWRQKDFLTDDEKTVIKRSLGFFAGSESLVSNNLLLQVFRWVNDGECRQYIARQSFEESLHNLTIVYICDSLALDIKEVYEAYREIESIKRKDDFLMNVTRTSGNSPADILRNIITYYIICEGILFFSGFTMLLSFGRQNKMPGVAEQIQYTYRDESSHLEFGIRLIQEIKQSYPDIWTKEFVDETREHIRIATELEIAYAHDVLPRGILGLNAGMFVDYMQFMANKRLESIGIPTLFAPQGNPFPWMTETIELSKMKNFFESRVTEYAVGQIVDDF